MSENRYKNTVNLPNTDFPIRAMLQEREPYWLAHWTTLPMPAADPQGFVLHDGPPYPNGNIHMGHALNKVLKDIILRYKRMQDKAAAYIPGWDCHGLPIEVQVLKTSGITDQNTIRADITGFRQACEAFARGYVDTQRHDFQRLGIAAKWDTPYLTLDPSYESAVLTAFAKMAENGIVYQGRKPIHWCMDCRTALAEAEIEYADHRSPSVYVAFKTEATEILPPNTAIAVWTTTPWTLPANVAVAAHPTLHYAIIRRAEGDHVVVAEALSTQVIATCSWENSTIVGTLTGQSLKGLMVHHPFQDRIVPLVCADYVSDTDGTGFVHIAPGHGQEDFQVGLQEKLPVLMPVENDGRFATDMPLVGGQSVFDANKTIGEAMALAGTLFKLHFIKHSYPHCWRCKNPVIFRATKQWFVSMDTPILGKETLRERALAAITETTFVPTWGANRLHAMIENRPDWCISRQRFWGIPIPVFYCKACQTPHMTGRFHEAVIRLVREKGSGAWFSYSTKDILPQELACDCGHTEFEKETDILDVWFESGASFAGVLTPENGLKKPADLYLEGSDQHRGWFQSSLLIGLGAYQEAPFKAVLTHGFLVDDKGRKMSKSLGNVISPDTVIHEYGADILRWWVANADFKMDIGITKGILNQSRDTFSKVRNTIRYCLSNLFDFDANNMVPITDLLPLDKWAVCIHNALLQDVKDAYDRYEFHTVAHKIHDACAVALSAEYLDMVKDRLYCDGTTSFSRRSTQTMLFYLADSLIRMIAPILPFTAEEAYQHFQKPNKKASVHIETFPTPLALADTEVQHALLRDVRSIRNKIYQELEMWRKDKKIKSFLDVSITLSVPQTLCELDWAAILIVSQVKLQKSDALAFTITLAEGEKCERCWKIHPHQNNLCARCAEALQLSPSPHA